jgi:hypothetical protein
MRGIMKPLHNRFSIVLATVALAVSLGAASVLLAQNDPNREEWIQLFNGRDLNDWIVKIRGHEPGVNFGNTFRVEGGVMRVSYDQYTPPFAERFGHIFYKQPFSHYRLRIEYRFVGEQAIGAPEWARRNSGVMVHSQDPKTMPAGQDFPISIEVQFLGGLSNGATRTTGNLCTPGTNVVYAGKLDTRHCFNSTSATFDGDQWVTAEVVVRGNGTVTHIINGKPVIEYTEPQIGGGAVSGHRPEVKQDGKALSEGYISLQSESHPVEFRKVELLPLKGCMNPASSNFKRYYVESDPMACK